LHAYGSYGNDVSIVSYASYGNDSNTGSCGPVPNFLTVTTSRNAKGEMTLPPINKFPEELHRTVKERAARKGISFKSFVIQALRYALANDHIIREKGVVDSKNEGGQAEVRDTIPQAARAATTKTRKP
jgi:hypothetical protein